MWKSAANCSALMIGVTLSLSCLPRLQAQGIFGLTNQFCARSDQDPPGRAGVSAEKDPNPENLSDAGQNTVDSEGEEGSLRRGPLSILQNLGSLTSPLPALFRSLAPIPHLARAPFAPRARTRLEPEALAQVEMGDFSGGQDTSSFQRRGGREPIRIVSWNIERGLQYERVLQFLREDLSADIYILQEVDRDARRTDFRDIARSLASELGMYFAYGIEFQELIQGKSGQPAVHGQATLSRFPIVSARVLRFENQPKDWSHDWFQPRAGGRMALVTKIAAHDQVLVIYNAHLESRGSDDGRSDQMKEIVEDFLSSGSDASLVVAGDLNTGQGLQSPVFGVAREQGLELLSFRDTLSEREARKQKDWILTARVTTSDAVLHEQIVASDHKPVSVRVWLDF